MSGPLIADAQLHRRRKRQPKTRILKPPVAAISSHPEPLLLFMRMKDRTNS